MSTTDMNNIASSKGIHNQKTKSYQIKKKFHNLNSIN